MKKFIIGFALLVLTMFFGIWAFSLLHHPSDVLMSPSGKYKVELYGDKRRPWFFSNTLTAKMYASEKILAVDEIHSADAFDTSFELTYQKYIWTNENILSFRGIQNHEVATDKNGDSLSISNTTDKDIRFLKVVFSVNMFLVLELPAHSSQTVFINHSKAPEYIWATGEFADGEKIKFKGVNFAEKKKDGIKELFKYCASVGGNEVSINSLQIEGYETDEKIIVPKVENCSQ